MRIVYINAVPYGSTGRIVFDLADAVEKSGGQALCVSGFTWKKCSRPDFVMSSNIFEKSWHKLLAELTGKNGSFSVRATKNLLKKIDDFNPDMVHLHNIHGWFINLPMLFDYLKKKQVPVVWTFHDCWSFTGHCPHFIGIGCEKWKKLCNNCPLHKDYPKSLPDNSEKMFLKKKKWFCGISDLTIVTPSGWLGKLAEQSFLNDYPVEVINNGIDLSVFKKTESDIKTKHRIENKHLVLGVSYAWDNKKGLDVFVELQKRLGEDYCIMLIGADDKTKEKLSKNMIGISRTDSQQELAAVYSAADVFVNPTREDNFPTVNMEALACGTPVITFETGGSPEIIDSECGFVVKQNDISDLEKKIRETCEKKLFSAEACEKRARNFDRQKFIDNYLELYRRKI